MLASLLTQNIQDSNSQDAKLEPLNWWVTSRWLCSLLHSVYDATLQFHHEEYVLLDQKLYISRDDAPQFLSPAFLADNVSPFTVFPNKMPRALPCLQTLSHQTNFLLILFLSHSQLSDASGRCLLNWKRLSPLFPHYLFCLSPSHTPMSSPILVSTGEQESVWLAPLNQRLHRALARQSRTTLIDVEQKKEGRGRGGNRDLWRETSILWCKGLWNYTYCKIIIVCNSFFSGADICPALLSTGGERDKVNFNLPLFFTQLDSKLSKSRTTFPPVE